MRLYRPMVLALVIAIMFVFGGLPPAYSGHKSEFKKTTPTIAVYNVANESMTLAVVKYSAQVESSVVMIHKRMMDHCAVIGLAEERRFSFRNDRNLITRFDTWNRQKDKSRMLSRPSPFTCQPVWFLESYRC